ncbi:hypothetical protein BGX31_001964 [Mortierella sp. GBA43]|nr:hypothetical protein BGX31_001964 [Mortierella sp. GBA43]
MPKGGSRASRAPAMSIAATLAAHKIATEKKPSSTPGNDTKSSAPPTQVSQPPTTRPPQPAPVKQPQPDSRGPLSAYTSSTSSSSSSSASKPTKASSASISNLPIHEDQVVSDATGSQINACQYNSTGEYILAGGVDRVVRLWSPAKGFCIKTYEAHGWEVLDIAVSPENGKFASCGGDKTVFLWDVLSGMTIRRFSGHTQDPMTQLYGCGIAGRNCERRSKFWRNQKTV